MTSRSPETTDMADSVARRMLRSTTRLLVLTLMALVLAGCLGGPEIKPPTQVNGLLLADDTTNPDPEGRSSPVVVRLYQLEVPAKFASSDFFPLFDAENETLGESLVSRDELLVTPGGTAPFAFTVEPGAHFFGVVAAFRDIDNAQWRVVKPLPMDREQLDVRVFVKGKSVSLSIK